MALRILIPAVPEGSPASEYFKLSVILNA